jgi:eukaryotic-like serine/threonine-protein kinase
MPARVTLRVTAGPIQGRVFEFAEHDTFLFGRSPECHAQLAEDDATASRHHFLLDVNPPSVRLRDLGSLNGTHVNGRKHGGRKRGEEPLPAAPPAWIDVDLHHGDEIRVGHTLFEVEVMTACPGCDRDMGTPPRGSAAVAPLCAECTAVLPSDRSELGASIEVLVDMAPPPSPGSDPPEAREVAGYDVGRLLGKGGMGAVFLARRRLDGATVALKVMRAQAALDDVARESFRREIEITRALRHPAIVALFDHGSAGNAFYFAMEYCAGGSLHAMMSRYGGPFQPAAAVRVGLQVLEGLIHAHAEGFIHRDLKPDNLLATDGAARAVKITDFGLAKSFEQAGLSGLTATGTVGGTYSFMPREQLTNFRQVRPISDVWSLGATLYYLLTGQPPRDFSTHQDPLQVILRGGVVPLRQRDPRLPEGLADVIDRALVDDLRARIPTAAEFRDELARVAGSLGA